MVCNCAVHHGCHTETRKAGAEHAGTQGPGDSYTAHRGTLRENSQCSRATHQALSVLREEQPCPHHRQGNRLPQAHSIQGCLSFTPASVIEQIPPVFHCACMTQMQSARQQRLCRAALSSLYDTTSTLLPCLCCSPGERPGALLSTGSPEQQQLPGPVRTCKPSSVCQQPAQPVRDKKTKAEPFRRQLGLNQISNSHHAL